MGLAAGLQRAVNFYGTESPGGANIPAPRVAQACQGWPVYHPQPAAQSLARARRRLPPQARQTEERLPAPPPRQLHVPASGVELGSWRRWPAQTLVSLLGRHRHPDPSVPRFAQRLRGAGAE